MAMDPNDWRSRYNALYPDSTVTPFTGLDIPDIVLSPRDLMGEVGQDVEALQGAYGDQKDSLSPESLRVNVGAPVAPDEGVGMGDYAKAFGAGAVGLGQSVVAGADWLNERMGGQAGYFSDTEQALGQTAQDIVGSMSPEAQARLSREWTNLDPNKTIWQGGVGEFLSSVGLQLAQTAPSTLVTLIPGGIMLRAGMGARAITYLGATEGALSLGQVSANIADEIRNAPREELMQSQRFSELLQEYSGNEEQARLALISEARAAAPLVAGVIVGAISAAAGRYLEPVFTDTPAKLAARFGRGAVGEGLFQEAPQSAAEQIAQNVAAQVYDQSRSMMQGVGEATVQGAALGGIMGGAMTAALGRRPSPPEAPPQVEPPIVDETTGQMSLPGIEPAGPTSALDLSVPPGTQFDLFSDGPSPDVQQAMDNRTEDMFGGPPTPAAPTPPREYNPQTGEPLPSTYGQDAPIEQVLRSEDPAAVAERQGSMVPEFEQTLAQQQLPLEDTNPPPSTPVDEPSAEPLLDLQAQVADLRNTKAPRKGVYLSAANVQRLQQFPEESKALMEGLTATEDGKGGMILTVDPKATKEIQAAVADPEKFQAVVGKLTGAGTGKPSPAGDVVVVQQVSPNGAVVRESVVPAGQVKGTAAKFRRKGFTVRTMPMAAALERRAALAAKEVPTNTQGELDFATPPPGPPPGGPPTGRNVPDWAQPTVVTEPSSGVTGLAKQQEDWQTKAQKLVTAGTDVASAPLVTQRDVTNLSEESQKAVNTIANALDPTGNVSGFEGERGKPMADVATSYLASLLKRFVEADRKGSARLDGALISRAVLLARDLKRSPAVTPARKVNAAVRAALDAVTFVRAISTQTDAALREQATGFIEAAAAGYKELYTHMSAAVAEETQPAADYQEVPDYTLKELDALSDEEIESVFQYYKSRTNAKGERVPRGLIQRVVEARDALQEKTDPESQQELNQLDEWLSRVSVVRNGKRVGAGSRTTKTSGDMAAVLDEQQRVAMRGIQGGTARTKPATVARIEQEMAAEAPAKIDRSDKVKFIKRGQISRRLQGVGTATKKSAFQMSGKRRLPVAILMPGTARIAATEEMSAGRKEKLNREADKARMKLKQTLQKFSVFKTNLRQVMRDRSLTPEQRLAAAAAYTEISWVQDFAKALLDSTVPVTAPPGKGKMGLVEAIQSVDQRMNQLLDKKRQKGRGDNKKWTADFLRDIATLSNKWQDQVLADLSRVAKKDWKAEWKRVAAQQAERVRALRKLQERIEALKSVPYFDKVVSPMLGRIADTLANRFSEADLTAKSGRALTIPLTGVESRNLKILLGISKAQTDLLEDMRKSLSEAKKRRRNVARNKTGAEWKARNKVVTEMEAEIADLTAKVRALDGFFKYMIGYTDFMDQLAKAKAVSPKVKPLQPSDYLQKLMAKAQKMRQQLEGGELTARGRAAVTRNLAATEAAIAAEEDVVVAKEREQADKRKVEEARQAAERKEESDKLRAAGKQRASELSAISRVVSDILTKLGVSQIDGVRFQRTPPFSRGPIGVEVAKLEMQVIEQLERLGMAKRFKGNRTARVNGKIYTLVGPRVARGTISFKQAAEYVTRLTGQPETSASRTLREFDPYAPGSEGAAATIPLSSSDPASQQFGVEIVDAVKGGALRTLADLSAAFKRLPAGHIFVDIFNRLSQQLLDGIRVEVTTDIAKLKKPNSAGRYVQEKDGSRVIYLNRNMIDGASASESASVHGLVGYVMAHETAHALSLGALTNHVMRQRIEHLMREVHRALRAQGWTNDQIAADNRLYGLQNAKEFVSEAYTNEDFRSLLREVRVGPEQPTIWQRWRSWFNRVIGRDVPAAKADFILNGDTALTAVERMRGDLLTGAPNREATSANAIALLDSTSGAVNRAATQAIDKFLNQTSNAPRGMIRTALKLMTMDQLADFFKGTPIVDYVALFRRRVARAGNLLAESSLISRETTRLELDHPAVAAELSVIQTEARQYEVHPDAEITDKVNEHVTGTKDKAKHAELRTRYLSIEKVLSHYGDGKARAGVPGKTLYQVIRDHYATRIDMETRQAVHNVLRAYVTDIDKIIKAKDIDLEKLSTAKGMAEWVKAHGGTMDQDAAASASRLARIPRMYKGPYFPLSRYGEWAVHAEKKTTHEFPTKEARKAWMEAESDGNPFLNFEGMVEEGGVFKVDRVMEHFSLHESKREAQQMYDLLQQGDEFEGGKIEPPALPLSRFKAAEATIGSSTQLKSILNKLEGNPAAQAAIRDYYARMLSDRSFTQHKRMARNIAGVDPAIQHRAFVNYTRSASHYIAQMEFGHQLAAARQDAEKAARSGNIGNHNRVNVQAAVESLNKRDEQATQEFMFSEGLRRTLEFSQVFHLLSPSYWMLNSSQPYMITLPYLSARYGLARSGAAMARAQGMIAHELAKAAGKSGGGIRALFGKTTGRRTAEDAFNILDQLEETIRQRGNAESAGLGDRYVTMLEALKNQNIIDLTQVSELRNIAMGLRGTLSNRIMDASRIMAHLTEVNNRVMTALATYDLAYSKRLERVSAPTASDMKDAHSAAVADAAEAVRKTQFNYAQSNKAPIMQTNVGRFVFQFMQYPQHIYAMLMENMLLMAKGNPSEVAMARKTLLGVFSTHFVAGGLLGIMLAPIRLLAFALGKAFEDDEPWDTDQKIREGLNAVFGKELGLWLAKGAFAGLGADMSQRMALGNLWFTNDLERAEGAELIGAAFSTFGGAPLGAAASILDGANQIRKGEYARGIESAMPKMAKDILKAHRYADEGLATRSGDVMARPEDVGAWGVAAQLLGITPTTVTEKYAQREAIKNAQRFDADRRSRLIQKFRTGDRSVLKDIREFNRKNPEQVITFSSLMRSRSEYRARQSDTRRYGVSYTGKQRGYYSRGDFAVTARDKVRPPSRIEKAVAAVTGSTAAEAAPIRRNTVNTPLEQALQAADAVRLPRDVAMGVTKAESSYGMNRRSRYSSARGAYQIVRGTFDYVNKKYYGGKLNWNDEYHVDLAGARYFKVQLDRFGDPRLAFAAHFVGPTKAASLLRQGGEEKLMSYEVPGQGRRITVGEHVDKAFGG